MKWIAATVTFDSQNRDLAADLVADIFYSLDLTGVVLNDPEMDPAQDWDDDAVPPPDAPGVTGYFADTENAAQTCRSLDAGLEQLERRTGLKTRVAYDRIDEEDWAESWKAYFWPKKITDTIVVKPTWREYAAQPGDILLEIDPGMAFGTGTHATTALCIGLLQTYIDVDATFLDVGTGSGILMIAAAKLGAGTLWGVDSDEVAITVSEQNLKANGIARGRFTLSTGHLVEGVSRKFDVIAANILADVILTLLPAIPPLLEKEGIFICSGIITAQKDAVLRGLKEIGFAIHNVREQDGWVAIAAQPS